MSQASPSPALPDSADPDPRRWKALAFIALAQLMVILDGTIVNIALPSIQAELGISDLNRQWVITAYAIAFGGLLLLGGRIADLWGRRRTFVTGLIGFAAASAIGGAAVNEGMMFASRAMQGVFGALLAPSALALLSVTFTGGRERAKAFGIFGAIAGGGAAIGLIVGGLLTDYLNWRWVFLVNIPIAITAVIGSLLTVRDPGHETEHRSLDIPGALLGTLGLVALVYGFTRAESHGWTEPVTVTMFVLTVVLLTVFILVQRSVRAPLLPLRVVRDRNRGGVYLSMGLAVIAMFSLFLFLTYYMQVVKGFSPIRTGVAFLPMVAGMTIGSTQVGARLMLHIPARFIMAPGLIIAAGGMFLLSQIAPDTSYTAVLLPGQLILGLGLGMTFMPAMSLATYAVQARDAGIASAMINTSQQVGGAIGIALLNTIAAAATTRFVESNAGGTADPRLFQLDAVTHGYSVAITVAAGVLVLAAIVAGSLVNAAPHRGPVLPPDDGLPEPPDGEAIPAMAG